MKENQNSTDLNAPEYQALAEFRYQIRRFLRFSEEAARAAGLEPQQHQLLLAVKGMPDGKSARIADLAERLQIQHHSAVELVNRLASKGLVSRAAGESDRREVHVQLTLRGERILRVLTAHHRNELRQTAPALIEALLNCGAVPRTRRVRIGVRAGARV
jgi:DNA-binding MarR family transcriptional regulator